MGRFVTPLVRLRAEELDRAAVEAQADEVERLHSQMAKARIGKLLDIRGVLTPEQQRKLREQDDDLMPL